MSTSNGTGQVGRFSWMIERFTYKVTEWVGTARAFVLALAVVAVWAITGPIYEYSNTWQLVINTSTTIVTFLMVFLLQRSQNKESMAVQVKLNEIIAALRGASNRLINIECLSEEEVRRLHDRYQHLVARFEKDPRQRTASHSIEEDEEEPPAPPPRGDPRQVPGC
jgi:low affinity Fe/Cu permease